MNWSFIIAMFFLIAYAIFMITKFHFKIKVTKGVVFTHAFIALAAIITFLALVVSEFNLKITSVIAVLLIVPGVILIFRAFRDLKSQVFVPETLLVQHGVYKRVRNPIYSGIILTAFGCVFLTFSALVLTYAAVLLVYYLFIIRTEERELTGRLGEDYINYKKDVPSLIPKLNK